jgi:hypothetical protein
VINIFYVDQTIDDIRISYNIVVDHFDLNRELVTIAMRYVDRYCAALSGAAIIELLSDKKYFQLLAMASLCLAIKLHGDVYDSTTSLTTNMESRIIETILQIGHDNYTIEQLKTMEVDILQSLQWLLHPPTPQVFISYFFRFFSWAESPELTKLTSYIVELSVQDYYFILFKPSVVALASLSNATHMLLGLTSTMMRDESHSWIGHLQKNILRSYNYEETNNINACRGRLMKLYANAGAKLEDFIDFSNNSDNEELRGMEPTPMYAIHQ